MEQEQYEDLKQQIKRMQELLNGLTNRLNQTKDIPHEDKEDPLWLFIKRAIAWLRNPQEIKTSILKHRTGILAASVILLVGLGVYIGYFKIYLSQRGLVGHYYGDTKLSKLVGRRLDPKIDFRWRLVPPMEGLSSINFSVRWKGYFYADEPGSYIFSTLSDDGVRLWINDALIFENWTVHGDTLDSGTVILDRGFHKLNLEYYQGYGGNVIRLFFQKPSARNRKIIPPSHLYPKNPSE